MVVLQEATTENIREVWEMQIKAFENLLQIKDGMDIVFFEKQMVH